MLLVLPGLSGTLAAVVSEGDEAVVRLTPAVRQSALPKVVRDGRRPHLVAPLLIDAAQLAQAPRVISLPDRRALASKGDRIAVDGDLHGIVEFRIVRPSLKLRDPQSGEHLGDEVISLGRAVLQREGAGGAHNFIITSSTQEITQGDLLIDDAEPVAQVRGAWSDTSVDARIVSIAGGVTRAAQDQVVGINKGARDNVVAGMSLALFATPEPHRAAAKNTQQQASGSPGNESGRLLIFRVYDRVSYGLITGSVEALQVGDKAFAPSTEYTPH
jgi:hypothetical protein